MAEIRVISGSHFDPSICRVGDDYFLANSSFEYMPGVPIWHSRDLLSWTQAGNAVQRLSQPPARAGGAESGISAPTLRHHDGRFWLVTTELATIRREHLIVSATDPSGPSTDPLYTTGALGIDPDLFWDDDGTCHLTWASFQPELPGIVSAPVGTRTSIAVAEWPFIG